MRLLTAGLCALVLAGCGETTPQQTSNQPTIKVRSREQNELHKLDAMNLAIALKRAIYDSGYVCPRITDAGFVGEYENLDMWMARCTDGKQGRDWAIFAGGDGSAQVRDCKDVDGSKLPKCEIKKRPNGKFGSV